MPIKGALQIPLSEALKLDPLHLVAIERDCDHFLDLHSISSGHKNVQNKMLLK